MVQVKFLDNTYFVERDTGLMLFPNYTTTKPIPKLKFFEESLMENFKDKL